MQNTRAYPQLTMLTERQCRTIHLASLEILRHTGVRIYHPGALDLLRQTEAVITDDNLVRMPPGLVEWALRQAPPRAVLCKRGTSEVMARLEGTEVNFGTGSDCLHYLDPRSGEHRPFAQEQDIIDCIHVADALPELAFCMSMGIPTDLTQTNVYPYQFATLLKHTVKPVVFTCHDRADCEAIVAMATAAAGGLAALRLNPNLLLYSEPSTPLKHSELATDKLLYMAEQGLPVTHSPAPMMGGTAPVTMAGGLALGNAEVLSSLVLHQLKRAGAPFIYGQGLHHLDMRTMISVYGAPEYQLARVLVMEMGRYYHLPTWGYAGHSDSCVVDEQAAIDSAFSVLVALLNGTNLAHDVGYLEAGLTNSPEMMVLTAENIAMMRHFTDGIVIDAETLALDVIHSVGPGGDFLTQDHTAKHFREYWQPKLFSRQRLDDWVQTGKKRLGDRLRDKTIALMEKPASTPLPGSVQDEVDYILNGAAAGY
jgi:trimethylamine---corrinoid protein Co-methyltransferase